MLVSAMSDTFDQKKVGVCRTCKIQTEATLYRGVRESGALFYCWKCNRCECQGPFGGPLYISKDKVESHLTEIQLYNLPVLPARFEQRCSKCGERGAELHHWAPRALFGKDEADQWPKDYLCVTCHRRWHQLVTPSLVDPL